MEKAILTVKQLAERWGVDRRTIYAAIRRGEIKVMRIGNTTRISRSHIEFLEQGRTQQSA